VNLAYVICVALLAKVIASSTLASADTIPMLLRPFLTNDIFYFSCVNESLEDGNDELNIENNIEKELMACTGTSPNVVSSY